MASPRVDRPSATWRQAFGLAPPVPGPWTWLADTHLMAALAAAVPVWCVLGLVAGAQLRVPAGWSAWLALLLLQPVAEEMAFRGVLQGGLLRHGADRRVGPVSLANLGSTAVFLAWHLGTQPAPWALATVVPSLVLGHLRERFDSIWPSVIVHMVYNAGFGLTAWWMNTP